MCVQGLSVVGMVLFALGVLEVLARKIRSRRSYTIPTWVNGINIKQINLFQCETTLVLEGISNRPCNAREFDAFPLITSR